MSAAASVEVEGCCWPAAAAAAEEGSAVRKDGSNSRVFSSVRGTFSASRFCGGRVSEIIGKAERMHTLVLPWDHLLRALRWQVCAEVSPGVSLSLL
jgi:hypothetical protein